MLGAFCAEIKIIIADLSASFLSSSTSPQSRYYCSWRCKREDHQVGRSVDDFTTNTSTSQYYLTA